MTDTPEYTPPEVWVWEKDNSPKWRYGNVNRPKPTLAILSIRPTYRATNASPT